MGDLLYYLAAVRRNTLPTVVNCNVLFNVIENARTTARIKKAKEISDLPTVDQTMLDSSGFSILTAEGSNKRITSDPTRPLYISKTEMNVAPLHVVQAACELQPNVMVSLDYPVRKLQTQREQGVEFKKKLSHNIKWAIETSKLRDRHCPHIPLLLAVQAYTVGDFMTFQSSLRDLKFEGFSMPVRNLNLQEIALFLYTFYRTGVKRAHLLGTSKFLIIALASYFSNHYFRCVSFDSQSWRLAAEHGEYLNPLNLRRESLRAEDVQNKEHLRRHCRCPVCREHSLKRIKDYPFVKRTALLRDHNAIAIQNLTDDLHQNAITLSTLETFLRSRNSQIKPIDELIRCLSLIDLHKNKDVNAFETHPVPGAERAGFGTEGSEKITQISDP